MKRLLSKHSIINVYTGMFLSLWFSQSASANSIPEIYVTTNVNVYEGRLGELTNYWTILGRSHRADTFDRDVDMIDVAEEQCKLHAAKALVDCQIAVLEQVLEGERECSEILNGWPSVDVGVDLSIDLKIIGGAISVSGTSAADRNQQCVAELTQEKELELLRCKRKELETNCDFL